MGAKTEMMIILKLLYNTGKGMTSAGSQKNESLTDDASRLEARGAVHLGDGEYDVTEVFSPEEVEEWVGRCRRQQRTYRIRIG